VTELRKETRFKLSVGGTCPSDLLETEGIFTHDSYPGRTVGKPVGGIFEMDSTDWSNGIRQRTFNAKPDTEFKVVLNSLGESLFRQVFAANSVTSREFGGVAVGMAPAAAAAGA